MKRGAERQITKDSEEPEIEEISGDAAFQKADDAVLATRKIKALPRKLGGSASFAGSPSDSSVNGSESGTPPPTKFSSFSGFGTPGSSSTGFSFVPPSSSPSFPPSKSTPSIFGPTPGTPTPSTLFSSGAPVVAPTASNAAKTLSSFLGGSSSTPAASSAPPPPPQQSTPSSSTNGGAADEAALKYYSSLRGLNVSILAAITSAIDQDPFVDIASLLNRYSGLRDDVQKDYDDRVKSDAPARSSAPSPSPFGGPSSASQPLKMPAAPAAFTGFGKPATPATPKTNGVVDPPPANPPASPFAFPASTSTTTAPKPSIFAPASTSTSSSTTPKPSIFAPSTTTTSSAFGSAPSTSLFGSSSSTPASPFGAGSSPSPFGSPTPFGGGSKPATSLFGSAGGNAFGSPSGSGSASPFGFGGGGSIGNPVGFSFASPKADAKDGAADKKGEDAAEGDADEGGDGAGTSQETEKASTTTDEGSAASSGLLFGDDTPSGLDAEGEGEEDEETVQQAKAKAYRMRKPDEGEGGWLDIGTGFVRLKKHKETSARRLLLRNTAGKIQINFALYSGLKASQSKKSLTLVGHDATGAAQTYSIRFRSEDAAREFQAAMDKEIAEIKPS
ncbi:RanBD1 domain-containing protein [Mycena venus]|uniref:RanBD1 domain-containing protein n=1 Tax=Mycena venus TaxID=2733690 RepID=A0A8H6YI87_9AGAR|nr:RanBD1 domain-containing protein [Mycena venus]